MRPSVRLLAVAAITAAALQVAGPSGAQTTDPSVRLDRTGTAAGERMLVTGDGWPAGATLIVELCGHGGLRGTADCDVGHQRTAGAGTSGTFSVELTTAIPPAACPCVVKATDEATRIAATAPIAVAGVPTVPLTEADLPKERSIEITSVEITGGGRWAELFGAGGRRVLQVTLANTGPLAVEEPDVTVVWGTGSRPTGFVRPPDTEAMAPGDTQVLTVPLDRPALTIGTQTAIVGVQGLAEPVTARATTTSYPWGLVAAALVVLQLVLLWVRNRVRRRLDGAPEPAVDGPAPQPGMAALTEGPRALPPGPGDAPAEMPDVIDLDEPAHPAPIALGRASEGRNGTVRDASLALGTGPTNGPEAPLEVMALQLQARQVIQRSVALSDAIVTASMARAQELDVRSAQRLTDAVERHAEAMRVLDDAKARADELIAAAQAAAAGAVRDASSHRAGAHQALVEMQAQHQQLAASAALAIDQVMRDLDEQMAHLGVARDGGIGDVDDRPTRRAPRLGSLDDRVARAVSLAFADTSIDATATD